MTAENAMFYSAYAARDARFDGVFFIGVTSTGVYCRPVCTARLPAAKNCRFFKSAAAAEKASFRPCLRCRPELAPGEAPVDDARRIARLISLRLNEGLLDDAAGIEAMADQFQLSSRQIRRIVSKELGVSPIDLVLTRRLLLAKQLLTETQLSVTEIAFASGFASLRRFNDAFRKKYAMPPRQLRKAGTQRKSAASLTLQLAYRPPFDWPGMLNFLRTRTLKGVEWAGDDFYARTVQLGAHRGWIRVTQDPARHALRAEISTSLSPALPVLLDRLRNLFDLDAQPDAISKLLMKDPLLKRAVAKNPGLRVPGAFDGFELAARAVLGQQVTVKAATTLAGRYAEAFGEGIETPFPELCRLSPLPEAVALAAPARIAKLGIVGARAKSIVALARETSEGNLRLEAGAPPEGIIAKLTALPGIGPWTAHYIAMRALRWPDAFPKEDIALRNRLNNATPAQAESRSQAWRPWRSYATLHLWHSPVIKD